MSMQRFIHIIRGLLSIVLTACSFGDEPAICPYNTRLEYWYAGSGTQNMLPTYVDNLRQYLFDADGQLRIVDFDDWPSFASCRGEAAPVIARMVMNEIKKRNQ